MRNIIVIFDALSQIKVRFLCAYRLCIFATFTINLSILTKDIHHVFIESHINVIEPFTYIQIASLVIQELSATSDIKRSTLNYTLTASQI